MSIMNEVAKRSRSGLYWLFDLSLIQDLKSQCSCSQMLGNSAWSGQYPIITQGRSQGLRSRKQCPSSLKWRLTLPKIEQGCWVILFTLLQQVQPEHKWKGMNLELGPKTLLEVIALQHSWRSQVHSCLYLFVSWYSLTLNHWLVISEPEGLACAQLLMILRRIAASLSFNHLSLSRFSLGAGNFTGVQNVSSWHSISYTGPIFGHLMPCNKLWEYRLCISGFGQAKQDCKIQYITAL